MILKNILLALILSFSTLFASPSDFAKEFHYLQNFQQAKEKALHVNKPLMVLFVTTTCPWCKKLENQTLSKEHINAFIQENFIPVILDKDKDAFPSYLKPKVVPTIYFVDSKKDSSYESILGYKKRDEFYLLLQNVLKKYKEQ